MLLASAWCRFLEKIPHQPVGREATGWGRSGHADVSQILGRLACHPARLRKDAAGRKRTYARDASYNQYWVAMWLRLYWHVAAAAFCSAVGLLPTIFVIDSRILATAAWTAATSTLRHVIPDEPIMTSGVSPAPAARQIIVPYVGVSAANGIHGIMLAAAIAATITKFFTAESP